MIRRYCDICGAELIENSYRLLSIGNPGGYTEKVSEESSKKTMIYGVELCLACSRKIVNYVSKDTFKGGDSDE